jgi:hypothetical protein
LGNDEMKTPIQETIAQLVFWTGIGCLPLFIFISITASSLKMWWKALAMVALGSIAATHFLWYFSYLGGALATKVGVFHPTPWWKFSPAGVAAAVVIAAVSLFIRCEIRDNKQNKAQQGPPPLPHDPQSGHSEGES